MPSAELDLGAFLAYYRSDGKGRPAYHPKMMTSLVLYCYCKGIRSSRAVEMACLDDVGCRVITGNLAVDHATVGPFRTSAPGRAHRTVRAGAGGVRPGGPGDGRPGRPATGRR